MTQLPLEPVPFGFCRAHSIPVGAGYDPPALVYYPSEGAPVQYLGHRTLASLREFTELGGIYSPPLMELTYETHRTVMAAPLIVLATVGTEAEENVVARMVRIRETALEFYRYRLLGGRVVQFVWENPKRDNGMVRDPLPADVDVVVRIVDHEVRLSSDALPYFSLIDAIGRVRGSRNLPHGLVWWAD
jgi:hypothetical protein